MSRTTRALCGLLASVAVAGCGAPPGGSTSSAAECGNGPDGLPRKLACTGLYADAATETLAADVAAYGPSLSMWADGAEKRRFIRLPPGTNATDCDACPGHGRRRPRGGLDQRDVSRSDWARGETRVRVYGEEGRTWPALSANRFREYAR
jgi:hypothetical protein